MPLVGMFVISVLTVRFIEQLNHLCHVRRKAGQIAGQVLGIADIGIDVGKERHFGFRVTGQVQSGPDHQSKETDDLEGHGLPAGIGTGDDEHLDRFIQENIVRHHLPFRQHEQGMPGLQQSYAPFIVEPDRMRLQLPAKRGPRRNTVELGQRLKSRQHDFGLHCDEGRTTLGGCGALPVRSQDPPL